MGTVNPGGTPVTPILPSQSAAARRVTGFTRVTPQWAARWRKNLSEAQERPVRIKVLGDSIAFGYNAGTRDKTMWELVATELQASHGDGGSGLTTMSWHASLQVPELLATNLASTGAWPSFAQGYGGTALATVEVDATLTLPAQRGRHVTVHYETFVGSGGFRVFADETLLGVVPSDAAASAPFTTLDVPPEVADGYEVKIENVTAGGCIIHAIDCWNDSGVVLHNMAKPGISASILSQVMYTGGGGIGFMLSLSRIDHDLMSWDFITNDRTFQVDPDTNYANWLGAIAFAGLQANGMGGDRYGNNLALLPAVGNDADGDSAEYVNRFLKIAESYGAPVINMYAHYGSSPAVDNPSSERFFATGLWTEGDSVHPNQAGHRDWADKILEVLR